MPREGRAAPDARKQLDADIVEIATSLRVSLSANRRRRRDASGRDAFSGPQLLVLRRLEDLGSVTIAELARHEEITPQSMGATVSSLEELGLVSRTADPTHGRRQLLSITAAGRKALQSGREARVASIAAGLREMFTDDEIRTLKAATPLIERLSQTF